MFVKEMENADKKRRMVIRSWLFCNFGIKEKIIDPRKINEFIEDVMDPYGRQDKIEENNKIKREKEDKKIEELDKKKEEEKKKLLKLFKNNKEIVDKLYDKIEKGETYYNITEMKTNEESKSEIKTINLKKMGNIVKLIGDNDDNIKLNIDDDEKHSRRSDSSNSLMDLDVVCTQESD